MLWELIRDFFVQHVFGGFTSDGDFFNTTIGWYFNPDISDTDVMNNQIVVSKFTNSMGVEVPLYLGDWLSTTATIISITIIVVLCCLFVYKIIKLIGGLIR